MKKTLKGAAAFALVASLALTPALAQTDADNPADGVDERADVVGDPEDDGFDHWGLLGLLGLAGLLKRPKKDVVVHHDQTQVRNPPR